jgi:hypothetical protein
MTILKVPTDVATSPQDSGPLRFDMGTEIFHDGSGNTWTVDELAAARPGNRIRKWVRENAPKDSGTTGNTSHE